MNIQAELQSCYGPERKPQRVPESRQIAEWTKRKNNVPQYSNVANERERRK